MASTSNVNSNEGDDNPRPSVNRQRFPRNHAKITGIKYEREERIRPKRKFREMSDPDVLHRAVYTYDKIFVEALVITNFDVNTRNEQCETPTHIATVKGHMDLLRYLVENGASVELRDDEGRIPLHVVAENGNPDPEGRYLQIAEYLVLKCKTNVNAPDGRDNTPLHKAVTSGSLGIVTLLLENGARIDALNVRGQTPLQNAIMQKNLSMVNLLLNFNADPKLRCNSGFSPLYYAVRSDSVDIVKSLIEHGAKVHESVCLADFTFSRVGWPSLHQAIERGNIEIVKLILEEDPDINVQNSSGDSALHIAARVGQLSIVQLLLDHGANIKQINEGGVTALYLALDYDHKNVAELLLARGAKWTQRGHNRSTMLHTAIKNKNESLFQFLLEKNKININTQDSLGRSPLHLAVQNGNLIYTRMLLERGARLNIKCRLRMTPLHVAINCRRSKVYKMLIIHGADVNARDCENRTPLHFAVLSNCYIAAYTLLLHNANINAVTKCGDTPLHYSLKFKQLDIFDLLMSKKADATIPDGIGQTALHLCIFNEPWQEEKKPLPKSFFEIFMREDSDIEIKTVDSDGYTALHLAVKRNCLYFVKKLLEYGANVNSVDKKGKTPLHLAVKNKNHQCIETLLIYGANIEAFDEEEIIPWYYGPDDKIGSIFESFLLKKALAGFEVKEVNIGRLCTEEEKLEAQRERADLITRCKNEIARMKGTRLYQELTYYDFLSLPIIKLVECAKDRAVANVFNDNNHTEIFPVYGEMLEKSFLAGQRFGEHMKTVTMLIYVETNFLFNQDIIDKVVSYIDLKDMRRMDCVIKEFMPPNLCSEELVESSSPAS